jgi:octaprenyl-diphosphate synthase
LELFFASAKSDVNDRLKEIIEKYDESSKLKYFLNSGKRLRPLLCLLTFSACNGGDYQKALDLAAAIELHHSASLVHDDIIDGDDQRRSSPSYHRTFGIEDAILTGHRAIVLGFKCILDHDPRIVRTLFDTWDKSLKGELEDINSRKNSLTFSAKADRVYYDVIVGKTASLFAGASKLGSQEADASEHLQGLFYTYGNSIGVAYQLADDMHDLGNGQETLPLAWITSRLNDQTKRSLLKLTNEVSPLEALSQLGIETNAYFTQAIEESVHIAEGVVKQSSVANGKYRQMLLDAPSYIVAKCLEE